MNLNKPKPPKANRRTRGLINASAFRAGWGHQSDPPLAHVKASRHIIFQTTIARESKMPLLSALRPKREKEGWLIGRVILGPMLD